MESDSKEKRMPLTEHLSDLRKALIRALLVTSCVVCITYFFSGDILKILEWPLYGILGKEAPKLYFTAITEKFFVYIQASILAAAAICMPYYLWEIWDFVSPGLLKSERKVIFPFLFLGTLAFVVGVVFCYFAVLPAGYKFLIEFGSENEVPLLTLQSYFSITLKLLLALGLVFELPIVLVILAKLGIVNESTLKDQRKYAFLASSVFSAIITPSPDAFTMLLVMIPLYLLYELSILLIHFFVSRSPQKLHEEAV